MEIYPSLISSDLLRLGNVLRMLDPYCQGYHIDVMDDHFVPNLTWGPAFIAAIAKGTSLPLHIHLMVDNPENWLNRIEVKRDYLLIFHYEAMSGNADEDICSLIEKIKAMGCKVGIAINPKTDIVMLEPHFSSLDHVLLMSVNPGFSGQKFIPEILNKSKALAIQKKEKSFDFSIGMDGGVGKENIKKIIDAGVDQVGVASAIFSASDPVVAIKELLKVG